MTAPTFVGSFLAGAGWTNSTSPKATASIDRAAGDVLVAVAITEDTGFPNINVADNTGITWTLRQHVTTASRCEAFIWTAVAASAANTTISFSEASNMNGHWGARVFQFSGSDGVGVHNKGDAADTAPNVTLTGVTADSAIVMAVGDWEAGSVAGTTYRTADAGSFTETDAVAGTNLTVWAGYYANAGSAGNKAVGLTAPSAPDWSLVAAEVLGTAGGTGHTVTPTDTEGLTDTRAFDHGKTLPTESLGLTDAATRAFDRPQLDNIGITDTVTAVLSREQSADDTLGLTDAIQTETSKAVAPADTLGLTDTADTVGVFERDATNTLELSDTLNISGDRSLAVDDTLGMTDTAATTGVFQRAPTDDIGITDSLTVDVGKLADLTDTLGLTDSRALALDANREPVETVGLTDTLAFQLEKVLVDSAVLTDAAAIVAAYERTITDTLGLTDERTGGVGLPDTNPLHFTYQAPSGRFTYQASSSHFAYQVPQSRFDYGQGGS